MEPRWPLELESHTQRSSVPGGILDGLRRHSIAALALFMTLGGSAYAAVTLEPGSVGSREIANHSVESEDLARDAVTTMKIKANAVTPSRIAPSAVNSDDVEDGSLTLADFKAGQVPAGPKGDTGSQGDKGDTGGRGQQGDKGDTGARGQQGDKGDTGERGQQGQQGDKGDTGERGQQGEKGDTGERGPQGEKGDTGDTGPQGEKGDTGDTGPQGPPGPEFVAHGAIGADGDVNIVYSGPTPTTSRVSAGVYTFSIAGVGSGACAVPAITSRDIQAAVSIGGGSCVTGGVNNTTVTFADRQDRVWFYLIVGTG